MGKGLTPFAPIVFAAVLWLPAFHGLAAGAIAVQALPGSGSDISVGAGGTAWLVGYDPSDKDRELYRWTGSGWEGIAGKGTRIAVDPAGMPWFAKGDGDLFRGVPYEVRLSMPIVRDGKVEFSFPTVSSANYVVQVWRDLGLPWAQLQRVAGDGSTVTVTDTPPAGLGASFYGVFQE